jgi:molecular chaperone GrpE
MLQAEAEDQPPNTVVKELQKGYMIHDRLLRPSLVAVSRAPVDNRKRRRRANGQDYWN